ncbi:VCBS repeat-containing protein [Anaeromyxobacter terrae]|uniref:VCBS repeat-containing protein n=1 Tax=Anaeromyxobacter terrae TaxID=2925406 RepID=UPI001F56A793|nr:VCBS repeat-containing protein [Anaeromyxobacter sp. SG22]
MRLAAAALALATAIRVAAAPPALGAAADALAAEIGPPAEGRRALALAVETRSSSLARPLEAALERALAGAGYTVTPVRGAADAEAAARDSGQDWLVRVQGGLVPGRRELALVGEVIPTWRSFFLQRRPDARAIPPRLVSVRAPADAEALVLAREGRPSGAPFAAVRPLARVDGRVLALAIGDAGGGGAAIAAVLTDAVVILSPAGAPLARLAIDPSARGPVRDPAATIALGDFGPGRVAVAWAGGAPEVLALRGGALERAGTLAAVPLCAGEPGAVFGAFAPGTGVLLDALSRAPGGPSAQRSARRLYGVAAAPRGGPVAFAALGTDLRLELLGPELQPAEVATSTLPSTRPANFPVLLPSVGTGFALADLDGDGVAEIVASAPTPSPPDRVRVLAARQGAAPLLEWGPIDGLILAGAGGDLTGDGVDDALLADVVRVPGGVATELLLVTSDPREAR